MNGSPVTYSPHNAQTKPYIWTAKASDILKKANVPAWRLIRTHLYDAVHKVFPELGPAMTGSSLSECVNKAPLCLVK
jgi:hypothetical protein